MFVKSDHTSYKKANFFWQYRMDTFSITFNFCLLTFLSHIKRKLDFRSLSVQKTCGQQNKEYVGVFASQLVFQTDDLQLVLKTVSQAWLTGYDRHNHGHTTVMATKRPLSRPHHGHVLFTAPSQTQPRPPHGHGHSQPTATVTAKSRSQPRSQPHHGHTTVTATATDSARERDPRDIQHSNK